MNTEAGCVMASFTHHHYTALSFPEEGMQEYLQKASLISVKQKNEISTSSYFQNGKLHSTGTQRVHECRNLLAKFSFDLGDVFNLNSALLVLCL